MALSASAQAEPATAGRASADVAALYGVWLGQDTGDINPYGFGLGAGVGYTLGVGLHGGARFEYFFGGSQESAGNRLELEIQQALGIVGYDFGVLPELVLRPRVGVGVAWTRSENCQAAGCSSDSAQNVALSPGVKALIVLGSFTVSGEAAYNRVLAAVGDADGFVFGLGAGGVL